MPKSDLIYKNLFVTTIADYPLNIRVVYKFYFADLPAYFPYVPVLRQVKHRDLPEGRVGELQPDPGSARVRLV